VFEVGFTEILLILGIALLVLGPEKLPGLAEKVGRWTGRARSMARQLRTQLEHEVTMEELTRSRAAQPAPAPSTPEAAAPEAAASDATPVPSGPELDLDAMVSGVEPATPAESAEDAAADAAVATDVPLSKSAS
jgi:sec-independent protein translocase protein TatB